MIELRSFANHCNFRRQEDKYYIQADGKSIKEVSKEDYDNRNYELLEKTFDEYLKIKWPSFWQNPLKWLGIIKS